MQKEETSLSRGFSLPKISKFEVPREDTLAYLVAEHNYIMQEKIDGRRLIVGVTEAGVVGYNKTYDMQTLPKWLMEDLEMLTGGPWVFDGEITDGAYYVFDISATPRGELQKTDFKTRSALLHSLVEAWEPSRVKTLATWDDPVSKLGHFLALRIRDAEGVVFKTGRMMSDSSVTYKHKFYKSVDCVVTQQRVNGKRTCEIGLMDKIAAGPIYANIGKVKVEYDIQDKMSTIDQVIEVRYRQVSMTGKLIEPVFMRLRDDKKAYACTTDQLMMPRAVGASSVGSKHLSQIIRQNLSITTEELIKMVTSSFKDEDPEVIESITNQLL